jgi:hypothetical protein
VPCPIIGRAIFFGFFSQKVQYLCSKRTENQKRVIFSRKAAKFAKGKMIKNVYKKSLRLCERIFSGLSGLGERCHDRMESCNKNMFIWSERCIFISGGIDNIYLCIWNNFEGCRKKHY